MIFDVGHLHIQFTSIMHKLVEAEKSQNKSEKKKGERQREDLKVQEMIKIKREKK